MCVCAFGTSPPSFQAAIPVGNPAGATRSCRAEQAGEAGLGVPRDSQVARLTSF